MKIFKRKNKSKIKVGKGNKFINGLKEAVQYSKDKDEYQLRFRTILNKADNPKYHGKGLKMIDNKLKTTTQPTPIGHTLENLGDSNTRSHINKLIAEVDKKRKQGDYRGYVSFKGLPKTKQIKSPETRFQKFKLKIKETWELTKEFGREIQYWLIAEYKIFEKLSYALNRKIDEVKVRKVLRQKKTHMINEYGYDRGTQYFNSMASGVNNSVRLHKRMEKAGL